MKSTIPTRKAELSKAQAAAYRLSKRFGFLHPSELTLEDIAMDCSVIVVAGGLTGCEARLIRKANKGVIRVKDSTTHSGRQRFSISHELGHWEQHRNSQWFSCTAADLRDYEKSPEEAEANTFAAELLMPTNLLRDRCSRNPSLELVKAISAEFMVSLTSAAIRAIHLTKQEAVLVLSKGKAIDWWISKSRRPGVWLEKGQLLSSESLANEAFVALHDEEEIADHRADVWFPRRYEGTEFSVSEQSMKLGGYDAVLTFLTIGDAD